MPGYLEKLRMHFIAGIPAKPKETKPKQYQYEIHYKASDQYFSNNLQSFMSIQNFVHLSLLCLETPEIPSDVVFQGLLGIEHIGVEPSRTKTTQCHAGRPLSKRHFIESKTRLGSLSQLVIATSGLSV